MYQRKTLRKMLPMTRRIAKAINEAESGVTKLKKILESIQDTEREVIGWQKRQDHYKQAGKADPIDWLSDSIPAKFSRAKLPK